VITATDALTQTKYICTWSFRIQRPRKAISSRRTV